MGLQEIAKRIDQAVKKSGKSNDVVAGECGLESGESVRLWRSGKTVPRLQNIKPLAKAVSVSDDWLLVGYSRDPTVNSNDLSEIDVEMVKRLEGLRITVKEPIKLLIDSLTSGLKDGDS